MSPLLVIHRYVVNLLLVHFNVGIEIMTAVSIAMTKNPKTLKSYYINRSLGHNLHHLHVRQHRFFQSAFDRAEVDNFFMYGGKTPIHIHTLLLQTYQLLKLFEIRHFHLNRVHQFYMTDQGFFSQKPDSWIEEISEVEFHIGIEEMIADFANNE